jgi:rubrerythrin
VLGAILVSIVIAWLLGWLEARRAPEAWMCPHCNWWGITTPKVCPNCGRPKPEDD